MDLAANAKLIPPVLRPKGSVIVYGTGPEAALPAAFCLINSIQLQFFLVYELDAQERERTVSAITRALDARQARQPRRADLPARRHRRRPRSGRGRHHRQRDHHDVSAAMSTASNRFGWYLAVLQLFFNLCWTVYLIYLPKLAAAAGLAPKAVVLILLLDQGIFTVCDFATGIATDKVTRVLGRLGVYVVAATALSCAAFLVMPEIAGLGAPRAARRHRAVDGDLFGAARAAVDVARQIRA